MAAVMAMAGGATSGIGALTQGQDQSNALTTSARIQRENATEALQKGAFDAQRQELIGGQKIGAADAAYGASGVTSTSGSVMDEMAMSHANLEMDRLNILHGADIRSINYNNQASMDSLGAEQTLKGSYMNAVASLFGAGSKAYGYGAGVNAGKIDSYDGYAGSGGESVSSSGGGGGMDFGYGSRMASSYTDVNSPGGYG